jgi:thymidylate kinase
MTTPSPFHSASYLDDFFAALTRSGIRYCYWTGASRIDQDAGLLGDLPLLVDLPNVRHVQQMAISAGFVAPKVVRSNRLPGVNDLLGFDPVNGSLHHLRLRHDIVLGERRLSTYLRPVDEWLLTGTRETNGVRVPSPDKELVLLYLRAILGSSPSILRSRARQGWSPLPEQICGDVAHLLALSTELEDAARTSGLPLDHRNMRPFLERVAMAAVDNGEVLAERRRLLKALKLFERRPRDLIAVIRTLTRSRSAAHSMSRGEPETKLRTRGALVAVVGADGSGKSTLSADLVAWLRPRVAVRASYMGQSMKWPILRAIHVAYRFFRRLARSKLRGFSALGALGCRWTSRVRWLYIAGRRRLTAGNSAKHTSRGWVVITDRYPLRAFWQMPRPMDGPRLGKDDTKVGRWLSRLERRIYASMPEPDAVLVLDAPFEVLHRRKPETPPREHQAKVDAIRDLAEHPPLIKLDSSRPYAELLLSAQQIIWASISAPS